MPDAEQKAEALRKLGHDIRVADTQLLSMFGRGQIIQRLRSGGKLVWAAGSDPRRVAMLAVASDGPQSRRRGRANVLIARPTRRTHRCRHLDVDLARVSRVTVLASPLPRSRLNRITRGRVANLDRSASRGLSSLLAATRSVIPL